MERPDDGRERGREALGPADRTRAGLGLLGFEEGERADRGTQQVHRVALDGHRLDLLDEGRGKGAQAPESLTEVSELPGGR